MSEHEEIHQHQKCSDLLSSLSDYVDGSVEPELCAEIERHMKGCQRCRIVVDTLKKTIELYQDTSEPEAMPEDVRLRLYKCLNLDDYLK